MAKVINLDQNGGLETMLGDRRWQYLEAASGRVDNACMHSIDKLHHPDCFAAIPDSWKTVNFRNRLFRMLSREAAMVHFLLASLHKCFPWILFLLPLDHTVVQKTVTACESSLDDWSLDFLMFFAGRLTCREALLEIAIIIILGKTSTVRIEALNALIRRIIVSKSNAVKKPNLLSISAEFALSRLRASERGLFKRLWSIWKKPLSVTDADEHPIRRRAVRRKKKRVIKSETKKVVRRPGGGGAWRAFVHARCRGVTKALFAELAKEYNNLSPEERVAIVALGRASALGSEATLRTYPIGGEGGGGAD